MITLAPYVGPGENNGMPAYTLASTGMQMLAAIVDSLSLKDLESRAWGGSHEIDSIWRHLWVDRLVKDLSAPIRFLGDDETDVDTFEYHWPEDVCTNCETPLRDEDVSCPECKYEGFSDE
jgi:hypothetical protein